MKPQLPLRLFAVIYIAATQASAAASDFTRTAVSNWNGREGVTHVRYSSGGATHGYSFKFDLSKGYRLKCWLGSDNTASAAKASVGEMAEAIWAAEGVAPVAGINGDYFDTSVSYAKPTGLHLSDSELASLGAARGWSLGCCYIAELGDHNIYHGKLSRTAGLTSGDPKGCWQLTALGRKIRNAVRTNYINYPVRAGAISPYEGREGTSGINYPTTVGNYVSGQGQTYYYHTLVGIGTNALGVATNLVLWVGDASMVRTNAYQLMIDEGCNEVGELDLGGSATLWSESCATSGFFGGAATAHGGYVMRPRDSSARAVANGIFVMPPPASPDTVALNDADTYPDMAEAMLAAVPGDSLTVLDAKPRHGTVMAGTDGDRVAIEWAPDIVFGGVCGEAAPGCTNGLITVHVAEVGTHLPDGCKLRLTVFSGSPLLASAEGLLGTAEQPLAGPGNYLFDTAGAIDPADFGDGLLFDCAVSLLDEYGEPIASAATGQGTLRLAADAPWFSADAATNVVKGGAWTGGGASSPSEPPVSQDRYSIQPSRGEAVFSANTCRDGLVRLTATLRQHGGYPEGELDDLLSEAVAEGVRAALVSVENEDGSTTLRGLAIANGTPSWVPLVGATLEPGADIAAAIDLDLAGETPLVSYLVGTRASSFSPGGSGGASSPSEPLFRLRSSSGQLWLPAAGFAARPEVAPYQVAGGVAFGGLAEVAAFAGTTAIPGRAPAWRDTPADAGRGDYSVAVLGDTHFDSAPDSLYHAAYDTTTSQGAYGIQEYRRSAEMWQDRMPRLLAASAALASGALGDRPLPTRFTLQLGDIINGDCNDDAVHLQYLKDALAATRAPYTTTEGSGGAVPRPFPFLTVLGNHDFRGSPNGRKIYFEWAEPLLSRELGENIAYPLFSFRIDDDRWIFCDFERVSLFDVAAEIGADQEARYVFLVTHGPFTPCEDGNNWVWRLSAWKGKGGTGQGVPELFEAISRRRAIVLSGHTHYTSFYRNENQFGGYTEFTANSVWKSDDLAHTNPFPGHDRPSAFGTYRSGEVSAANRAAYDADIAFFKAGLKEYFLGPCAGHFRLEVTDDRVLMRFYPGDASEPGRTFDLTPGPRTTATMVMLN